MRQFMSERPEAVTIQPEDSQGMCLIDISDKITEVKQGGTIVGYEWQQYQVSSTYYDGLKTEVERNFKRWVEKGIAAEQEQPRIKKLEALSLACNQTIEAGIDVETATGMEHFDLDVKDQLNLLMMGIFLVIGMPFVPYQSNGGDCTIYSAKDAMTIFMAYATHRLTQSTYYNQLKKWVERLETVEEIEAVQYGDPLPEDLQQHVAETLTTTQEALMEIIGRLLV